MGTRETAMFDITQPYLDEVYDQPGETRGVEVDVTEHESEAMLLGPDGNPLRYEAPQAIGFDLTPIAKG